MEQLKWRNMRNCGEEYLVDFCQKNTVDFVDPEFPPNYESIGITVDNCTENHDCYIHWRRLKYINFNVDEIKTINSMPYLFSKEIEAVDIQKGKFDNP